MENGTQRRSKQKPHLLRVFHGSGPVSSHRPQGTVDDTTGVKVEGLPSTSTDPEDLQRHGPEKEEESRRRREETPCALYNRLEPFGDVPTQWGDG